MDSYSVLKSVHQAKKHNKNFIWEYLVFYITKSELLKARERHILAKGQLMGRYEDEYIIKTLYIAHCQYQSLYISYLVIAISL